jgi:hypothetical protein
MAWCLDNYRDNFTLLTFYVHFTDNIKVEKKVKISI